MADDAARSVAAGKLVPHRPGCPATMADGLMTNLSERTLATINAHVDAVVTPTEAEMASAYRLFTERTKLLVEPSAAVGLAVALHHQARLRGARKVCVVLCGGNVDVMRLPEYFSRL
jgi:threonine dehydratase